METDLVNRGLPTSPIPSPTHPEQVLDLILIPFSVTDVLNDQQEPENPLPLNRTEVGDKIEASLKQLRQLNTDIETIQEKTATASSIQSSTNMVQTWITDFVLKGGASAANAGLPFLIHSPIPKLNFATETIKVMTDFIDISAGTIGFIYQCRILQAAREQLEEIKANHPNLDADQKARFRQLEKLIKYEEQLVLEKGDEQIFRSIGSVSSTASTILTHSPTALNTALNLGVSGVAQVFSAALHGLLFYRAHQKLETHRNWSKEFKSQMTESNSQITQEIDKYVQKREVRHHTQINKLKEKIERKEITMESIQKRIEKFKIEGLQHFLDRLMTQKISLEEFKQRLEEKEIDAKLICSIYSTYSLINNTNSTRLSPEDKQEVIKTLKALLAENVKECIQTWMSQQSEDSLLSLYIDYHSVIDTTVKGALTEMVKKKHKIEKGFLKFEKISMGTKFTVATIVAGVVLALAIIALVSNPVGATALIIMSLTIAAGFIGGVLTAAGFGYAYLQKPASMISVLTGAHLQLACYQAMAELTSVKEEIEDYFAKVGQDKKTAQTGLATLSLSSSQEKIEADFQKGQSKAEEWRKKADQFKEELEHKIWTDFANQADLKIANLEGSSPHDAFDTLDALSDALNLTDLHLLSDATKELLEKQLGIDLYSLQVEIEKDPSAVKKLIQNFFNLKEGDYIKFIRQQAYLHSPQQPTQ